MYLYLYNITSLARVRNRDTSFARTPMERCLGIRDDVDKTPLHSALLQYKWELVEELLRDGADPNLANASGSTLLHVICARTFRCDGNPMERFLRICDDVAGGKTTALLVDARDKLGRTPLHLAVLECNWPVVETLLSRGADPAVTDKYGSTPLHTYSETEESSFSLPTNGSIPTSIESCLGRYVNALDTSGYAPLHLALSRGNCANLVEWLLSHGADPNLPGWLESTPLHIMCKTSYNNDDATIERFFGATNRLNLALRLDARDRWGQTPLHYAVLHDKVAAIGFLLRSRRLGDDANDLVNAKLAQGKTPLQLAVAKLMPDMVDVFVDNGADLSGFVFPSDGIGASPLAVKSANRQLELAWRALTVVERLESVGYRLCRRDATAMMRLLDEYRVFEASMDLRTFCTIDETFEEEAMEFNVRKKLTLHELIHWPIARASKRLTSMSDKAWAKLLSKLDQQFNDTCDKHLCKIMLRNFCLAWAMDPFRALMHRSAEEAPNEVCLMIFEHLSNKDLCNICWAVAALEGNEAARSEDKREDAKRIAEAPKKRRSKRLSKLKSFVR